MENKKELAKKLGIPMIDIREELSAGKIPIPIEARSGVKEYRGIPVKDAFYTAGYLDDGSGIRYIAPMNHTETLVLDGRELDMYYSDKTPMYFLARTGNPLIGLRPQLFMIQGWEEKGGFVEFDVRHQGIPETINRGSEIYSILMKLYEDIENGNYNKSKLK